MSQPVTVAVADLLLDEHNARLADEVGSQQQAALALAKKLGKRLVGLAESITEMGLDPAQLISVVATGDRRRKYIVQEGNRRTLALKALETPTLVQPALAAPDFRKLQRLAAVYATNPIETVECILYGPDEIDEVNARIVNRHSGSQDGAGLVEWDSDEKDRFAARHGKGKQRSLGGQALDFLAEVGGVTLNGQKITTTLTRLLTSPEVREAIGLERVSGELRALYPTDEIAEALRFIVEDLASGNTKVTDVYTAEHRTAYAAKIPSTVRPTPGTKLAGSVRLGELPTSTANPPAAPAARPAPQRRKARPRPERTTVAAPDSKVNPAPPRANAIYTELVSLSASQFPNAGSVLMRVFVEISVDEYRDRNNLVVAGENYTLAKKMKDVADHLHAAGKISDDIRKLAKRIADTQHGVAPGIMTFHQYVHNRYVFPKETELRAAWDELQPFLEAVWAWA